MNKQIDSLQFCTTYIILEVVSFLGVGVYTALNSASIDAYISAVISIVILSFLNILFIFIWNYEPSLPIYLKTKRLLGEFVGTIFNIILIILAIGLLISGTYNFISFITSQLFNSVPAISISIAISIVIIYFNSKGINSIFKTAPIIFVINLSLFLAACLSLVLKVDLSNIFPIIKDGFSSVLEGTVYISLQGSIPIFYLLIIPKDKVKKNKNTNKYLFLSQLFGSILVFFLIFFTITSLGESLIKYYSYPEYMVLKDIEIFGFIDRIENAFTIQWIFGYILAITIGVYYLNKSLRIKKNQKFLQYIITIIIMVITPFAFKSEASYAFHVNNVSPYFKITYISIYVIMFLIILIKKKKRFKDK